MQHLEVSCAVRRFFKSLGFKGLRQHVSFVTRPSSGLQRAEYVTYKGLLSHCLSKDISIFLRAPAQIICKFRRTPLVCPWES